MKTLVKPLAALLLSVPLLTMAADDLHNHPGYLDPGLLSFTQGMEPSVEVTLQGPVLKMLLQLPIQYDEANQVQELLKEVSQILVRIYSVPARDADSSVNFIAETSRNLESRNWQRIVRVREEANQSVDIHVKVSEDGENLNGLVVMAVESKPGDTADVVFVNIAGNFNPAYLANIGDQFDIDYLHGVQLP
jgi:hypothetical protein